MKKFLLVITCLWFISSITATDTKAQIFFRIRPATPRVVVIPACPAPGSVWIDGYWARHPRRGYYWVDGYWERPRRFAYVHPARFHESVVIRGRGYYGPRR